MRKIKQRDVASILIIIFALASLFVIGNYAKGYDNLFFACPKLDAAAPIEKAADMNLTYETGMMGMDIKVFSVNHAYSRIMGCKMLSGSFFTQTAQEEKRKNVVLNEKLAFDTFGNFDIAGNIYKINGESYVVVGVMDDKQDEKNAYIPTSTTSANFLAVIDTEEKTIADLKSLGVTDSKFHLVNISEISGIVRGKPWLAIMITLMFWLSVSLYKIMIQILGLVKRLKHVLHEKYWSELIKTVEMRRLIMLTIIAFIEIGSMLWIFLKSFEIILRWTKYAGALNDVTSLAFGGKVQLLQSLCLYSNTAFCVFIIGIILGAPKSFNFLKNEKDMEVDTTWQN